MRKSWLLNFGESIESSCAVIVYYWHIDEKEKEESGRVT